MTSCIGYVAGWGYRRGEQQPRCKNEAKPNDVYCWDHRAEVLRHAAETTQKRQSDDR